MEKVERYYWLDLLKIIACFCVIVNHSAKLALPYINNSCFVAIFNCIQYSLCKIGVPLFIMVSGYLFLVSSKSQNFTYKMSLKRIFRILVPLILLSILLQIYIVGIENFNFINFIKDFLVEPVVPAYWYLYMLIGLYLVTPFIKKMIDKFELKDYKIFLLVFLVIPSIFPIISEYLGFKISSYFFAAGFNFILSLYIAGAYLSKIDLSSKSLKYAMVVFLLFTILYFISLYFPYLNSGVLSYKFDSFDNIFCVCQSLSLFYIVRYFLENRKIGKYSSVVMREVSKTTFGIYLIHFVFIDLTYNLTIVQEIFSFSPNLGIVILELTVFLVSGIITFVLRHIPFVKDFC